MKKCIYCGAEINDNSVLDVCERCGKNVWGEKMFNTIIQNMENARQNNDLCNSRTPIEQDLTKQDFGL